MKKQDYVLWGMLIGWGGFALGWIAAAKVESHIVKDGWDIAAALGTVAAAVATAAAVFVALFQNGQQRDERKSDATNRAHIVAATRIMGVHDVIFGLEQMERLAAGFLHDLPDSRRLYGSGIFRVLSNPMLTMSTDELLAWHQLDRQSAVEFAVTLGILRRLAREMEELNKMDTWNSKTAAQQHKSLEDWRSIAAASLRKVRNLAESMERVFDHY